MTKKEKVIERMVKNGWSKEWAIELVEKHFEFATEVYGETAPARIARVIIGCV